MQKSGKGPALATMFAGGGSVVVGADGKQEYVCEVDDCRRKFETLANLRRHEVAHPLRCPQGCNEMLRPSTLRMHMMISHNATKCVATGHTADISSSTPKPTGATTCNGTAGRCSLHGDRCPHFATPLPQPSPAPRQSAPPTPNLATHIKTHGMPPFKSPPSGEKCACCNHDEDDGGGGGGGGFGHGHGHGYVPTQAPTCRKKIQQQQQQQQQGLGHGHGVSAGLIPGPGGGQAAQVQDPSAIKPEPPSSELLNLLSTAPGLSVAEAAAAFAAKKSGESKTANDIDAALNLNLLAASANHLSALRQDTPMQQQQQQPMQQQPMQQQPVQQQPQQQQPQQMQQVTSPPLTSVTPPVAAGTDSRVPVASSSSSKPAPVGTKSVTSKGRHVCTESTCRKDFSSAGELARHQRIHTGERPFKCTYKDCNKAFSESSNLRTHSRVHTGEKPFVCDHKGCNKRFAQSGHLHSHRITHTSKKPAICKVEGCNKAFTQSGSLARHMRTHTGERPYKCDVPGCDKAFRESSVLSRHKVTHTGKKPFACGTPGCDKKFAHPGNLLIHQRAHEGRIGSAGRVSAATLAAAQDSAQGGAVGAAAADRTNSMSSAPPPTAPAAAPGTVTK